MESVRTAPNPEHYTCVIEIPAGIIRTSVSRLDTTEILLDTRVRLKTTDRFEVVVEHRDGPSEVIHARFHSSGEAGVVLRWDFQHPREMISLDRLLDAPFRGTKGRKLAGELEEALKHRSLLVRTSAIAARRDSVRVLSLSVVKDLIQEALDEAIESSVRQFDREEREQLLRESESQFRDRLAGYEEDRENLNAHIEGLKQRVVRAQQLLEEERKTAVGVDRFSLSEKTVIELEHRLSTILDAATLKGQVSAESEQALRRTLEDVLDRERERVRDLESQAHNDRIGVLDKKVGRLSRSLDEARQERDRAQSFARKLEVSSGARFSRQGFEPGLSLSDPNRVVKLRLLTDLVDENRQLREQLVNSDGEEQSGAFSRKTKHN